MQPDTRQLLRTGLYVCVTGVVIYAMLAVY